MSWLLTGNHPNWTPGQPFGEGSERWKRARDHKLKPWDDDCYVTPLIGGRAAMDEIRKAFEAIIAEAETGANCHVYIAGWRLNPNRDMTIAASWDTPVTDSQKDHTAWGLVRRMMFAGVKVRILLWLPPTKPLNVEYFTGFSPHIQAHFYLARLVKRGNKEAKDKFGLQDDDDDLGVVFLDRRIAEAHEFVSSHHQKFIVVRGTKTNVAFCGGVDLAYTRRDAPVFEGDWQSGNAIPTQDRGIKVDIETPIQWEGDIEVPEKQHGSDLPQYIDVPNLGYYKELYGMNQQIWHDQHLKLEGPVVKTLEHVFVERWSEPSASCLVLGDDGYEMPNGSIISSSKNAFETKTFLRTHTINGAESYYIDYGVRSKSDIEKVRLAGQDQDLTFWRVDPQGRLSFPSSLFRLIKAGDKLEILYRRKQPKSLLQPLPVPIVPASSATPAKKAKTQIWLTIPLRGEARDGWEGGKAWVQLNQSGVDESRIQSQLTYEGGERVLPFPYRLGEFSNMAGIANACGKAKELIWIFDQYFWSVPYGRLLAKRLNEESGLHVIIVLPPWSDMGEGYFGDSQHRLRWTALRILGAPIIFNRVAVYIPWYTNPPRNVGIYCHAKVQLFDDDLLVCGSCNINERSYSVDSEVCCAVESKQVVQNHYEELWNHFIKSAFSRQLHAQNFTPGWGARFFSQLKSIVSQRAATYLHEDNGHINQAPILPNGVVRNAPEAGILDKALGKTVPDQINEPHGLPDRLYHVRNLAEIVDAIERFDPSIRRPSLRDD